MSTCPLKPRPTAALFLLCWMTDRERLMVFKEWNSQQKWVKKLSQETLYIKNHDTAVWLFWVICQPIMSLSETSDNRPCRLCTCFHWPCPVKCLILPTHICISVNAFATLADGCSVSVQSNQRWQRVLAYQRQSKAERHRHNIWYLNMGRFCILKNEWQQYLCSQI